MRTDPFVRLPNTQRQDPDTDRSRRRSHAAHAEEDERFEEPETIEANCMAKVLPEDGDAHPQGRRALSPLCSLWWRIPLIRVLKPSFVLRSERCGAPRTSLREEGSKRGDCEMISPLTDNNPPALPCSLWLGSKPPGDRSLHEVPA